MHRVIKFNQKAWIKSYIEINSELRKKAKNDLEKDFFRLMNNSFFGETIKNVRKHRNIKHVTTEKIRNCLVSEPNYYSTEVFTENLRATKMKKTQIFINKPVYLGLSRLELSKIVMYEFWYDYVKPKYEEKAKLYYIDTGSSIVYTKTDDVYKGNAKDAETRFDTSNYELDRPSLKRKNKKAIALMQDELGGKVIKEFDGLRSKTYSYLIDNKMKI